MDEVALAIVILAADQELEGGVGLCVVDDAAELSEGGSVDNGADKVVKGRGGPEFEGFCVGDEGGFEGGVEGGWDVGAGGSAAFLALVLESAADGLEDGVLEVSALVDEVEVFAAGFADDAGVGFVGARGYALGDLAVEGAEDGGAAGVVEAGKLGVGEDDVGDGLGVAGDELDDIRRKAGFEEDAVD